MPNQPQPSTTNAGAPRDAHADALERLRNHVERAAVEIKRLRRENARLRAHVQELEANPGLDHDGALLPLDEAPGPLRERIQRFISAIDHQLARPDSLHDPSE